MFRAVAVLLMLSVLACGSNLPVRRRNQFSGSETFTRRSVASGGSFTACNSRTRSCGTSGIRGVYYRDKFDEEEDDDDYYDDDYIKNAKFRKRWRSTIKGNNYGYEDNERNDDYNDYRYNNNVKFLNGAYNNIKLKKIQNYHDDGDDDYNENEDSDYGFIKKVVILLRPKMNVNIKYKGNVNYDDYDDTEVYDDRYKYGGTRKNNKKINSKNIDINDDYEVIDYYEDYKPPKTSKRRNNNTHLKNKMSGRYNFDNNNYYEYKQKPKIGKRRNNNQNLKNRRNYYDYYDDYNDFDDVNNDDNRKINIKNYNNNEEDTDYEEKKYAEIISGHFINNAKDTKKRIGDKVTKNKNDDDSEDGDNYITTNATNKSFNVGSLWSGMMQSSFHEIGAKINTSNTGPRNGNIYVRSIIGNFAAGSFSVGHGGDSNGKGDGGHGGNQGSITYGGQGGDGGHTSYA